ncbi:MAG: RNA polymerase sigma factor [Ktedonobacteraceae bacterium]
MSEPALDAWIATDPGDSASLAEIVQRAQTRDHAAFEYLYHHFKTSIWRRLIFLVGEKEIVNDLFQETFLRAWNGLPGTSSDLQFGSWLKRIAANVAIDYLRHNAAIEFFPLTGTNWEESQSLLLQVAGPEASVSERECIEQALAAMLPRYRICVLLQDQWGFSQREIAQLLSITEKCVSSYICRGRGQMRQIYKRLSGDAEKRTKGESSV